MTRKKRRVAGRQDAGHRNPFKEGTGEHDLCEALDKGLIPEDEFVRLSDEGMSIYVFFQALDMLANPLHISNRWSTAVKVIRRKGKRCLQLVHEIPPDVRKYWEETGYPPKGKIRYLTPLTDTDNLPKNPYKPGTDEHFMFGRASGFRRKTDILVEAEMALKKPRSVISEMWSRLGDYTKNGCESSEEHETLPDGTVLVRLVNFIEDIEEKIKAEE